MSKYRKEYLIGEGGMGAVYRGMRLMPYGDELPVACKVIQRKFLARRKAVRRFHREAALTLDLAHAHVVRTIDYVADDDGGLCLVMELVQGVSVAEIAYNSLERAPLSFDMLRVIADDVLAALDYVHGCGVLHRDISPENMLVCPTGAVKVADFGVAKALTPDACQSGDRIGKLAYMAPEIRRGAPVDERSDLFSLAATLYDLLTRDPPFGVETSEVEIRRQQYEIAPLPDSVPDDLRTLVMDLLGKNPDQRCAQTASEARAMLHTPENRDAIAARLGQLSASLYEDKCARGEYRMRKRGSGVEVLKARPVVEVLAEDFDEEGTTLSTGGDASSCRSSGNDRATTGQQEPANGARMTGSRSRFATVLIALAVIVLIVTWGSSDRSTMHDAIPPASRMSAQAPQNAPQHVTEVSQCMLQAPVNGDRERLPNAAQPPTKPRAMTATRRPESPRQSRADTLPTVPESLGTGTDWSAEWMHIE